MKIDIDEVKTYGFFDTRRILKKEDYEATKAEILEKTNKVMPLWEDLVEEGVVGDLRVLLSDIKIIVIDKAGFEFSYEFKVGYTTDLASVPKALRSFVDNDDKKMVIAALVHDANFGCQFLSFKSSNELFRQMIREAGGSWWLAFKAYWGVNSSIGRGVYNKTSSDFAGMTKEKEFCQFSWTC